MPTEHKIIYRNSSEDFGSLSIPERLVQHRVELFTSAFRNATRRLQEECKDLSFDERKVMASTLIARHKEYFDQHFEPSSAALKTTRELEESWAAAQDPKFLSGLGLGDAEVGVSEVLIAIAQLAHDEVEPLLQAYRNVRTP